MNLEHYQPAKGPWFDSEWEEAAKILRRGRGFNPLNKEEAERELARAPKRPLPPGLIDEIVGGVAAGREARREESSDHLPYEGVEGSAFEEMEKRLEGPATSFQGTRETKYGDLQVNVFSATSNVVCRLPLRTNEYYGSPTGFECGYAGAGPHQLAYSMLRECGFDKKSALQVSHGVVTHLIAGLPEEGTWIVTREQVLEAAESYRKSIVVPTLFK